MRLNKNWFLKTSKLHTSTQKTQAQKVFTLVYNKSKQNWIDLYQKKIHLFTSTNKKAKLFCGRRSKDFLSPQFCMNYTSIYCVGGPTPHLLQTKVITLNKNTGIIDKTCRYANLVSRKFIMLPQAPFSQKKHLLYKIKNFHLKTQFLLKIKNLKKPTKFSLFLFSKKINNSKNLVFFYYQLTNSNRLKFLDFYEFFRINFYMKGNYDLEKSQKKNFLRNKINRIKSIFYYLLKLQNFEKFETISNFSILLFFKALYFNPMGIYLNKLNLELNQIKQKFSFIKTLKFLFKESFYNEKLKLTMFQLKKLLISSAFFKTQLVVLMLKKLNLSKTFEFNFNFLTNKFLIKTTQNLKSKFYLNFEAKKILLKIKTLLVTIFCFCLNTNFWLSQFFIRKNKYKNFSIVQSSSFLLLVGSIYTLKKESFLFKKNFFIQSKFFDCKPYSKNSKNFVKINKQIHFFQKKFGLIDYFYKKIKFLKVKFCNIELKKLIFFYNLHYYFYSLRNNNLSKISKKFGVNEISFNYMKLQKLIRNSIKVRNNIFHLNIFEHSKLFDFFYLLILSNLKNFKTKLKLRIFSETYFNQEFLNKYKLFPDITKEAIMLCKFPNSEFIKIWLFEGTKQNFFCIKYLMYYTEKTPSSFHIIENLNIKTRKKLVFKFFKKKTMNPFICTYRDFFDFNFKILIKIFKKNLEAFFFDYFFFKFYQNFKFKQNFNLKKTLGPMFCFSLKLRLFFIYRDFLKNSYSFCIINNIFFNLAGSLHDKWSFWSEKHLKNRNSNFQQKIFAPKFLSKRNTSILTSTNRPQTYVDELKQRVTGLDKFLLVKGYLGPPGYYANLFFISKKEKERYKTVPNQVNEVTNQPKNKICFLYSKQNKFYKIKNFLQEKNHIIYIHHGKQKKKKFKIFYIIERTTKMKYEVLTFFFGKKKKLKFNIAYVFQIFYLIKMSVLLIFQKNIFLFNKNSNFLKKFCLVFLNWIKNYYIFKKVNFFLISNSHSTLFKEVRTSDFDNYKKINFSGFLTLYFYFVFCSNYSSGHSKFQFFVLKTYCFFQKSLLMESLFFIEIKVNQHFNKKNVQIFLLPTYKNLKTHLEGLKILTKQSSTETQFLLMNKLTLKIVCWCYFYKIVSDFKILNYCDNILVRFLWKWACKLHQNKSKKWIQKKYFLKLKLMKITFQNAQIKNLNYLLKKNNQKKLKKTWVFFLVGRLDGGRVPHPVEGYAPPRKRIFKVVSKNFKFSSKIFYLPLHTQTPLKKLNLILNKNL